MADNPEKFDEKKCHAGHRQRMRERMRKSGFDGFAEHEILEFILFHSIRRGNTNVIGHALLETFGSFNAVFRASYEELIQVPGVGASSADYIIYLRELMKALEKYRFEGASLKEADNRCAYFLHKLSMETDENLLVACLDETLHARHMFIAAKGTPGSVHVSFRSLMHNILCSHCNIVVLAHNHPQGKPMPSCADIELTTQIARLLKQVEVELADHIIVADGRAVSMLQTGAYTPYY